MELTQASAQWASRPDDERFTSLTALRDAMTTQRQRSREVTLNTKTLTAHAINANELTILSSRGEAFPTNWAFNQLATLAQAPSSYLRDLPAPLAAECINYGLHDSPREIGALVTQSPSGSLDFRAATGPRYGRIWNSQVAEALVHRFGDGLTGDFRIPGEFGKPVPITKANTTLYGSDRDMFVFLADEERRIELPGRRDGQPGSLARGFFIWNSEVGSASLGIGFFLFDYTCSNRIVWGAEQYTELRIRHSAGAPDRWLAEAMPSLHAYAEASMSPIESMITGARQAVLPDPDSFLLEHFGKNMVSTLQIQHLTEEHRPIVTIWDAATAATAFARDLPHQDTRVELERRAGALLKLAA